MQAFLVFCTEALTIFVIWSWDFYFQIVAWQRILESDGPDDPDGGISAENGALPAPFVTFAT